MREMADKQEELTQLRQRLMGMTWDELKGEMRIRGLRILTDWDRCVDRIMLHAERREESNPLVENLTPEAGERVEPLGTFELGESRTIPAPPAVSPGSGGGNTRQSEQALAQMCMMLTDRMREQQAMMQQQQWMLQMVASMNINRD